MRQTRIDKLKLKARVVGLVLFYMEEPRRPSRSRTSAQRKPRPMFCFYTRKGTNGPPLYVANNSRMADAFIVGFAEARSMALRGENRGNTMASVFDHKPGLAAANVP